MAVVKSNDARIMPEEFIAMEAVSCNIEAGLWEKKMGSQCLVLYRQRHIGTVV